MSTYETDTQLGRISDPSLLEDSRSYSENCGIESHLSDETQTDEGKSLNLTEDFEDLSLQELFEPTAAPAVEPIPILKLDRANDPYGKAFLLNFFERLKAAENDYPDSDDESEDEPVKESGAAIQSQCWAEQLSGQTSQATTDDEHPEAPTHPGQPWESDDEDSDSEYDDDKYVSVKEHGDTTPATFGNAIVKTTETTTHEAVKRQAVTYKSAFGRITLETTRNATITEASPSVAMQTYSPSHTGPVALDITCPGTLGELIITSERNAETEQTLPHSVTAPIGPIAEPESFRNEFYEVKRSATAGYGAFALRNLVRGQTILIEKSLLHADNSTLRNELKRLTPELCQAFDRMHGHGIGECDTMLLRRIAIFKTNSFMVNHCDRGVFLTASKFNHACRPKNNVAYMYDKRHDAMVFTVERDIEAGNELFITYGKDPETLFKHYGFICRCGGCEPLPQKQFRGIDFSGWGM